MFMPTVVA